MNVSERGIDNEPDEEKIMNEQPQEEFYNFQAKRAQEYATAEIDKFECKFRQSLEE